MDMNSFRPEIHVAQQSRRDKLRFHSASSNPPSHHPVFGVYNNNLTYDPPEFCPEINHFNHPSDTAINRHYHDPQSYYSTWKSIGSQSSSTTGNNNCWVSPNNNYNQTHPSFVNSSDNNTVPLDVKPYANLGYQEMHSSHNNNTNHQSSDYYHSALQDLVSTSGARSFVPLSFSRQRSSEETSHGPWVVNGGELVLLPAYADQLGLKGPDDYSNTQALALSLSSVPSPKVHEAERNGMVQDFKIPKNFGNARQDHASGNQALTNRNPGPLGPFTGYATILRSSKFLRPAQVLLEELCGVVGRPKNVGFCEEADRAFLEDTRVSDEGNDIDPAGMKAISRGDSSGWMDSYRPENFQKKANLLHMQDEVYKKYKQYHQQMQMVISSFETVAGLSASTPYVSLALRVVSKHFRCLKNAITDQLRSIRNTLGEELLSPSAGTSSSKGGGGVSMLKFIDQSFQKQKGVCSNLGINLDGQSIWRPQRGLPERAVSILRAWLFDHFLHPYPTDTDKHMLATQTGLTRNQVSNWFINARVRVWKPMVEEIHMLETNGTVDADSDVKTTIIGDRDQENHTGQCSNTNTLRTSKMPENYSSHFDLSEHTSDRSEPSTMWNQEKRSRIDYHVPASAIDPSLMGFVPSHRGGVEMAGMGSVSLTLGLRQGAENGQRQSEHHRLRQHYGGQIIRDFVG